MGNAILTRGPPQLVNTKIHTLQQAWLSQEHLIKPPLLQALLNSATGQSHVANQSKPCCKTGQQVKAMPPLSPYEHSCPECKTRGALRWGQPRIGPLWSITHSGSIHCSHSPSIFHCREQSRVCNNLRRCTNNSPERQELGNCPAPDANT